MEKTGQMIEFEEETGGYAIVTVKVGFAELQFPSEVYVKWIEAKLLKASVKATAYDRLMVGGKKTLNEIANIFGSIVAMDESGRLHLFGMVPKINKNVGEWQPAYRSYHERVPICDIDYTGSWQDSLTLPDGWEEA